MSANVDLSEFEALANPRPKLCVVGRSAELLSAAEREKFDAALVSHHGHNTIAKWLALRGLGGRDQAVKEHREGTCCCERS